MILKRLGKTVLSVLLERQVQRLRQKNDIKVIAVVGSVGKTTTKLAIVTMLQSQIKLQHQAGNYNDRLTIPLVFFGQEEPGIYDVLAWCKILLANWRMLKQPYPYDLVVLELGADGPGQLQQVSYTNPDILVVTALTDEHMRYFKTLDAVASEELSAAEFSKQVLINADDCPQKYTAGLKHLSYGQTGADFTLQSSQLQSDGRQLLQTSLRGKPLQLPTSLLGTQGAKSLLAAAAVADLCGLTPDVITQNAPKITAVPGRMQLLPGLQGATIIDDSYNASPIAMRAALDVLYALPNAQRIAVLGNMNEMGVLSPDMHRDIGAYCDPAKLALVITIGPDANSYLAPAAAAAGCTVKTFTNPYEAGEYIRTQLHPDAAILIKGSQNGVFSEETVKVLLADPADSAKLVRQSNFWLKRKKALFGSPLDASAGKINQASN